MEIKDRDQEQWGIISSLKFMLPYFMRCWPFVLGSLFSLVLAACITLEIPLTARHLLDYGLHNGDRVKTDYYFMIIIVMVLLLAVVSSLRYYCVSLLGERVASDLRIDVFSRLMKLSPSFFDSYNSGENFTKLMTDTEKIRIMVSTSLSIALRNLLMFLGAIFMMLVSSFGLSALVMGIVFLVILFLAGFSKIMRKRSNSRQKHINQLTQFTFDSIKSVRMLQAFVAENKTICRYKQKVEKVYQKTIRIVFIRSCLTAFAISFVFSGVVVVLWFGLQKVISGTMSGGALTQFMLYSIIAAGSISLLSDIWGEVSQVVLAIGRLRNIIVFESNLLSSAAPVRLTSPILGQLAFHKVSFSYSQHSAEVACKTALHNLSFIVNSGETVAIVGSSGAGKSTIASLALRFYDPDCGCIELDGIDLRNLPIEEVRRSISFVPQDPLIIMASLHDNIAMGKSEATRDDVKKAAIAAQAHEFIAKLEKGYDTTVGEGGVILSVGQRQRIAIARAILKESPVILLDEPTSSLDAENEILVWKALEELRRGRTTIVISHRFVLVQKADNILVLSNGCLVEEGTHDSLMERGGFYTRLAELQISNVNRSTI
ncbi:ABC-type multidrug transport system, ATPase and permease components [Liberibacter crescens BT-1]|uniref:ABC-type multidrug transport system, ATPase and permease components n=1 Tax=Liberibacter crescens (strain BT-1) TaxID=1215343 RepID=L0EU06_LIBCB|nr:ABC transporter transmembrane domain-containing protein [Liberibacter crescens]AGA64442.1 ABC-type multidrug transport system, ATPase and permease components [Liberibacter crescens BT-1]AMC12621.1 hypothetical protein RL73_02375 [Liberibacter crescens]